MECDSASDYIAAFKSLRPIGTFQAFNGWSELTFWVLKWFFFSLVDLCRVLLDQVGKTLRAPRAIQFRLTTWLLLALRDWSRGSLSPKPPIIAPRWRSPAEVSIGNSEAALLVWIIAILLVFDGASPARLIELVVRGSTPSRAREVRILADYWRLLA